jgi:hypothetical protein
MAGVDIAEQIRKEDYDEEVHRYIAACALDEGVTYLPPPLDFAQRILSQPMYRCRVCGQIDTDDIDGRCDFCTGRFQDERPLNFKPAKGVTGEIGTDLEKFLTRDPASTEKRFNEVKRKGRDGVTLDEDVSEDVQAAKMMVAYNYMTKRRKELVDQLEELKSWVTH